VLEDRRRVLQYFERILTLYAQDGPRQVQARFISRFYQIRIEKYKNLHIHIQKYISRVKYK